jgi:CheY-like chemotaxis protein
MKIMYVEDDPDQQRLLQLRYPEWQVDISATPEGARSVMDSNGHEVIVVDLDLGPEHPWERTIRFLQEMFAAPIIAYSGYVDDQIRARLMVMGVQDVLTKGDVDDWWHLKRAVEGAAAQFKLKRLEEQRVRDLTDVRDQIRAANQIVRELRGKKGDAG